MIVFPMASAPVSMGGPQPKPVEQLQAVAPVPKPDRTPQTLPDLIPPAARPDAAGKGDGLPTASVPKPSLADREATVTAMMEPRETAAPQAAKPDGQAPPAAAGPHPSFAVGRVADEMLAKAAPQSQDQRATAQTQAAVTEMRTIEAAQKDTADRVYA